MVDVVTRSRPALTSVEGLPASSNLDEALADIRSCWILEAVFRYATQQQRLYAGNAQRVSSMPWFRQGARFVNRSMPTCPATAAAKEQLLSTRQEGLPGCKLGMICAVVLFQKCKSNKPCRIAVLTITIAGLATLSCLPKLPR